MLFRRHVAIREAVKLRADQVSRHDFRNEKQLFHPRVSVPGHQNASDTFLSALITRTLDLHLSMASDNHQSANWPALHSAMVCRSGLVW